MLGACWLQSLCKWPFRLGIETKLFNSGHAENSKKLLLQSFLLGNRKQVNEQNEVFSAQFPCTLATVEFSRMFIGN